MKNLYLAISLLSLIFESAGQCTTSVPSNALVITINTTNNGGFDPLWVCPDVTLVSDGGIRNIYLEPQSLMTTSGGIDTIFVKPGAALYMDGGIHVICYVNITDITIAGGIPTLIPCSDIVFDYSNAPASGCTVAPVAAFTVVDAKLCAGSCTDFQFSGSNAATWQWSFPGGNPSTSTLENPQGICYPVAGTYEVTLIVENNQQHDTLTVTNAVTVYDALVPDITEAGDSLFVQPIFSSYQWYWNGNAITGATSSYYIATASGLYEIATVDVNDCPSSDSIQHTAVGTTSPFTAEILIYPNPAIGNQAITIIAGDKDLSLMIYSAEGKLFSEIMLRAEQQSQFSLPAGIYWLAMRKNEKVYFEKLIVQ